MASTKCEPRVLLVRFVVAFSWLARFARTRFGSRVDTSRRRLEGHLRDLAGDLFHVDRISSDT